jgi:hypothetical protein
MTPPFSRPASEEGSVGTIVGCEVALGGTVGFAGVDVLFGGAVGLDSADTIGRVLAKLRPTSINRMKVEMSVGIIHCLLIDIRFFSLDKPATQDDSPALRAG